MPLSQRSTFSLMTQPKCIVANIILNILRDVRRTLGPLIKVLGMLADLF